MLFSPIKTISSNLLDFSSNKPFTPAVRVIAQSRAREGFPPTESKLWSLCCTSPLCIRKTEVNQYFHLLRFLNSTTDSLSLFLSDAFCSGKKKKSVDLILVHVKGTFLSSWIKTINQIFFSLSPCPADRQFFLE